MSQTIATESDDQVEDNPVQALRVEAPVTAGTSQLNAETTNALLVVAALVMTATYQAVLQPPGGLWQDDPKGSNSTDTNNPDNLTAGKSIMGTDNPTTYVMFLACNSIGFFCSYTIVWSLLEGFPMKWRLRLALVAIVWTYDVSMGTISPSIVLNWIFFGMSAILPIIFSTIAYLAERMSRRRER